MGNPESVKHVYRTSTPQSYTISATAADEVSTYDASKTETVQVS
jgi:hypothetical protein